MSLLSHITSHLLAQSIQSFSPLTSTSAPVQAVAAQRSEFSACMCRELRLGPSPINWRLGFVRKVGGGRIAAMIDWRPAWQSVTNSPTRRGN